MSRAHEIHVKLERLLPDVDFRIREPRSVWNGDNQRHLWQVELRDCLDKAEVLAIWNYLPDFVLEAESVEAHGFVEEVIVLGWYE